MLEETWVKWLVNNMGRERDRYITTCLASSPAHLYSVHDFLMYKYWNDAGIFMLLLRHTQAWFFFPALPGCHAIVGCLDCAKTKEKKGKATPVQPSSNMARGWNLDHNNMAERTTVRI